MNLIKKYVLIILGSISLIMGAVGILLPVLPTTPFLLLAAYCFLRSSKAMYNWLINHRIFGEYIYNYLENRAVKKSVKISALLLLWPSLFFSMFVVQKTFVSTMLFIVGIFVTLHILSLRTITS